MNVIVTILGLTVVAVWAFAVYNRLLRLRERVKDAWKRLEPRPEDAALQDDYNARVKSYNDALAAFPANLIAGIAGFQVARVWRGAPKA
jgi:hypothetical protein